jgi:hypothetical protein
MWSEVQETLGDFLAQVNEVVGQEGEGTLKSELTGESPFTAIVALFVRDPGFRSGFLPEILLAIERGPSKSLLAARDLLRTLPRGVLEERVPGELQNLLSDADEEDYARLGEVFVELRLASALQVLRSFARDSDNDDIRSRMGELDGVEHDTSRWGRLVQEWPVRETETF